MAKDKYEISLWQDKYVAAVGNIPAHFEEEKIAVIGSNTITAPCRAYEPTLTENINGSNTFTFKMHYKFKEDRLVEVEEQFGEFARNLKGDGTMYDNPFLSLLVNERKVKVYWKDKWYDFVIKNCQVSSDGKHCTYTCRDSYIAELSKTGFNIEFDTELENNQGTAYELALKTLEDTDWTVLEGDTIQQETEEPGYYISTRASFSAENETDGGSQTIASDAKIFVFYSYVQKVVEALHADPPKTTDSYCQLLYDESQQYPRDTNSQLIIDVPCFAIESGVNWTLSSNTLTAKIDSTPIFTIADVGNVSNQYRGSRLVKSQKCILDSLTDKYSYIYEAQTSASGLYDAGDTIYEYRATLWNGPTAVMNVVANASNFKNLEGWHNGQNKRFQLYPDFASTSHTGADFSNYHPKSFLRLQNSYTYNSATYNSIWYYNVGLTENATYIPAGIQRGEQYVFRAKVRPNAAAPSGASFSDQPGDTYVSDLNHLDFWPGVYGITKGETDDPFLFKPNETKYIDFPMEDASINGEWVEFIGTCKKSFSREEAREKIGLFLLVTSTVRWLEAAEFFPLVMGEKKIEQTDLTEPARINPGEMNVASVGKVVSKFYNYTQSIDPETGKRKYTNETEIPYIFVGGEDDDDFPSIPTTFKPIYNSNFEKIRTITVKNSNRFNILQTIAETFECWCKFEIEHESNGATKIIDGVPQKFVRFVKEVGQETGIGFIYGIDLKTISRTIQSDQIVTKTIVTPNNNEFAKDGFCTIARSTENYTRDTFILNFDYYINQGLLDGNEFNLDLYSSENNHLNYYNTLRNLNMRYDAITEKLVPKKNDLTIQKSYQRTYEAQYTALKDEIDNLEEKLAKTAAVTVDKTTDPQTYWEKIYAYVCDNAEQAEIAKIYQTRESDIQEFNEVAQKLDELDISVADLQQEVDDMVDQQKSIQSDLKAANLAFFKKYSRFIQEGFWISEDYMDDNLYYLDAQSVAYTSSRPQVSYEISVVRISSVEGFENKIFRLGDISFIQDTEFFGYTTINGVKTPIKEKVLVSEITSYFDTPDQDKIKIQNYKTQFEDLFHRIVSTTQQLQYTTGEYARAANGFQTNGSLEFDVLQASFDENAELVMSAQNESIIQDNTGITVSDSGDPRKKTRITSNGIFITTDGGTTWKNAVRGEGIATQYLTAGTINVADINIYGGTTDGAPTFKWDSYGLDAFAWDEQNGVNLGKFVRHDQFGFYGVDFNEPNRHERFKPQEMSDVWDNANFGLTWDGFFFRNTDGTHQVEISSTDDIKVVDIHDSDQQRTYTDRIKIGKIGVDSNENNIYGFLISDKNGNPVLKATDEYDGLEGKGSLWLKDVLNISDSSGHDEEPTYSIQLGQLPGVKEGTSIHEMFNVNQKFIVYEDGSMIATSGKFTGIVEMNGGSIGDKTLEEIEDELSGISKAGTHYYPIENTWVINGSSGELWCCFKPFQTISAALLMIEATALCTIQIIDVAEPATLTFYFKIKRGDTTTIIQDYQPTQTFTLDGIYTMPLFYSWMENANVNGEVSVYVIPNNCKLKIKKSNFKGFLFGRGLAAEESPLAIFDDPVEVMNFGYSALQMVNITDTLSTPQVQIPIGPDPQPEESIGLISFGYSPLQLAAIDDEMKFSAKGTQWGELGNHTWEFIRDNFVW